MVDRSFYVEAACRNEIRNTPKKAWTAEPGKKYRIGANIYDGDKLIELALLTCAGCPVQWKCAATAIEADEMAGTWSDTLVNIRWLGRRSHYQSVLDLAQLKGQPVQHAIARLRLT